MPRPNHFMCTINYPKSEPELLTWLTETNPNDFIGAPGLTYIAWVLQQESRLHWQVYMQFDRTKRIDTLAKEFGVWSEQSRGSAAKNRAYIFDDEKKTNVDKPEEWGEMVDHPGQGARTDLATAMAELKEGSGLLDVIERQPGLLRMWSNLEKYQLAVHSRKRKLKPMCEIQILWGDAGAGKSSEARNMAGDNEYFMKPEGPYQWFSGYTGQKVVIWNEFEHGTCPFIFIKKLCDVEPFSVQTKGGHVPWLCELLILTAQDDPLVWWSYDGLSEEDGKALMRRVKGVRHMRVEGDREALPKWGSWMGEEQDPDPILCTVCGGIDQDKCEACDYTGLVNGVGV